MKKFALPASLLLILVVLLTACGGKTPTEAPAVNPPTEAPTSVLPALTGDPIRGGMLYYDWMEGLGLEVPATEQPLWSTQSTNTRTGNNTWRCKECHGWDYKGFEGAYGSGSHFTGFIGVLQVIGTDANNILAALKGETNPDHDFSPYMDEQALIDIALFLSEGVLDSTAFIDANKIAVGGNLESGKSLFNQNCATCHGSDGTAINFGSGTDPVYVGPKSLDNPWEVVHKARFGIPNEMPAMALVTLETQDYIDLLAYTQSLPAVNPVTSLGGLLYDNWVKVVGATVPGDQPLWSTQDTNTRTGNDTWRCKECHGWDYKGFEGAYSSGSHFTGFSGVYSAREKSSDELLTALKSDNHDFSTMLDDTQLGALVIFVQQVQDLSIYINSDKSVIGDPSQGMPLFEATCAACHGLDGKLIDFDDGDGVEIVGTLALDNPWEIFGKIAYGQPGADGMPAAINLGWTWQEIADVLAYLQSLPTE